MPINRENQTDVEAGAYQAVMRAVPQLDAERVYEAIEQGVYSAVRETFNRDFSFSVLELIERGISRGDIKIHKNPAKAK